MSAGSNDATLPDETGPDPETGSGPPRLWIVASPVPSVTGRVVTVSKNEPFLIGRAVQRGGISIDDPRMSRVHARITWDGRSSCYRVSDAGSANGVHCDGGRCESAKLHDGSVLRLGSTVAVFVEVDRVAELEARLERVAPSELTVLIKGEMGTGKEVLARRIHAASRRDGPFVAVNCAALPSDLLASELFGHARGAFSGASADRPGLFRTARGGTLFLDEIGDMPIAQQPALLRALQERAVRPVGSEREVPVDVRVLSATNRDLDELTEQGSFRADLHARLAQVELETVPLRKRRHELPQLVAELSVTLGMRTLVAPGAMEALALRRWERNVRELQAVLGRLKLFGSEPYELSQEFLDREVPVPAPAAPATEPPRSTSPAASLSQASLADALARHDGRVADVARELGTSRVQVYRWLKRFGMATPRR